ncbi:MAG: thioredoxin family protein [candidate division KSB1 bacterium]|nr:thioredoxin family protein [candidate division KSB1 bacterium]MDZ7302933.1 thioredoxin family protein [candidate division KSB1 bacterium]MDZ7312209.1 thioredoxin family protein [candidate division KSB1 bacterium]
MMKRFRNLFWISAACWLPFATFAGTAEMDKPVPVFKLKGIDGKEYNLESFKNTKAVVLMFIATRCPYSNAYNERMVKLFDDYKNKGVVMLAINSNNTEPLEEVRKHAADNKFEFPVLKDEGNVVADAYGAQFTPEIFLLDAKLVLRYHGRIDNSHKINEVETHDLRNALDAMLAGKEISKKETKAFGCTIKRVKKESN